MALPPWLPAPTPFEPRLQVGAWLTLWCWAGAPLLPALPWLGSLLSGCIGLAEASHGTTGGSSQALGSETSAAARLRAGRASPPWRRGAAPRAAQRRPAARGRPRGPGSWLGRPPQGRGPCPRRSPRGRAAGGARRAEPGAPLLSLSPAAAPARARRRRSAAGRGEQRLPSRPRAAGGFPAVRAARRWRAAPVPAAAAARARAGAPWRGARRCVPSAPFSAGA